MKQLQHIIMAITASIFLLGCNSDDDNAQSPEALLSFETLAASDIAAMENTMASLTLNGTNDTGVLWDDGKVLLYKTSDGRLGKLRVLNLGLSNAQLTIEAVTYNTDGNIHRSTDSLEIQGNDEFDLDEMVLGWSVSPNDFLWERVTELQTRISPLNEFIFVEWEAVN
ncbi:hypothetical protein [Sediminibacter sp. Hel_I_10]|uniref:hypothetical protein n=1 Tax=Sediminibacter sp. Hel_I_10 TaxID=1392490 RepID=UPI000479E43D|nr:hypothetical protein [Sediminibacter sp. Hel_I_10]